MLNKKYKLYSSILALCMTLALMATGVWAILQQSLGVSTTVSFTATSVKGTINGEVEGGYAGITTDYEATAQGGSPALTGAEIIQFGPKYVFANITGTKSSWNGKEAYYVNEEETTEKVGEVVSSAILASAEKNYTVSNKSYVSSFSPTSPSTDWTIAGMTFQPNSEGQTSAITITLTIENTGSNIIEVSFPDDNNQWSDSMSEATAPSDNLLVSYATSDNGSAYSEPQAFSTIGTKSIVSTGITSIKILITVQDDSSSIPGINLAFQVKLEKGVDVWGGETAVALSSGIGTELEPFLIENGDQLEYLSTLAGSDGNHYYYKLTNNIVLNNASFSFKEASGLVEVKNRDRTLYLGTALEPTGSVTFSTGTNSVAGTVYTLEESVYTACTTVTADTGLIAIGTDLYIGTGTAGDTSSSNTQFDETASVEGQFYAFNGGTYTPSFLNVWSPIGSNAPFIDKKVDGDGYEISGIYINTTAGNQGLFGFSMTNSNTATIKNINLVNGFVKGGTNVGGIAGFAQNGLIIDNCSNSATIYGNVAGGINGMMTGGNGTYRVLNSSNSGTISGTGDIGGINAVIPVSGASITNCYNMGTVYTNGNGAGICVALPYATSTISNCYNFGNVSGLGSNSNTCGIIGTIAGNVTNCYNYGNVSGLGSYANTCGIIGTNAGSTGNITNCYNYGNVSGSGTYSYIGGIIGTNAGNITNCHNYGDIDTLEAYYIAGIACVFTTSDLTISNCSNNGSVSANSTTYVAGIVGHLYEGTMVNCYNTGTINNDGGNIAGVASDVQGNTNQITYCYNTGNINNEGDSGYTGGVFGQVGGVLISNCYNTGNIQSGSESYTGGVGGFITVTSLLNCYNTGNIVSSAEDIQIAGVAGYSNSDIVTNCYNTGDVEGAGWVAGVIAECQKGALTGCYNTGDIRTAFNSDYLAGVISFLSTSISATNCYNTGIISGGAGYIGGVFGQSNCQAMTNCYNTGSVTGTSDAYNVGGVVGGLFSAGTSTNCYNTGAISGIVGTDGVIGGVFGHASGTVSNCYNIGAVTGTADGTGGGIGGIMGRNTGTFKNGYNTGNVNATATYSGGIAGYNTNTLANTFNIGTVTGSGTVGSVAGYNRATSGVITYSYYLVGSATNAIGSDLGTSANLSDFDSGGQILNSEITIGTTLLTVLNAWVTENQTTPAYKTFIVGANGYPVFA